MDLNYLFFRQQVEKIRASTAGSDEARTAHEQMARCYEMIINEATADSFAFPVGEIVSPASPQR
jgi:hypothetical protein